LVLVGAKDFIQLRSPLGQHGEQSLVGQGLSGGQADSLPRLSFPPLDFQGRSEAVIETEDLLWQSIGKDGDGDEMWVPRKYTEQDVPHDLHHPKRKLPYYIRESQRIEKERQTLPMVRLERFFKLLQTNLMADVPENKTVAFIQPETPMIFSFDGYYYIGITYPCAAEGLQPVTQEAFMAKREDLLRVQRDMEAMNDGEHLS
jgi:hypothetical protein